MQGWLDSVGFVHHLHFGYGWIGKLSQMPMDHGG